MDFPIRVFEKWKMVCLKCGLVQKVSKVWRCKCGHPLTLITRMEDIQLDPLILTERPLSLWRYREVLPVVEKSIVSLGEPLTPLIQLDLMGLESCFIKLDFLFPTGSFKDRGSSIMISAAKLMGVKEAVEDSSGNAGASVAAYCAKAGISCKVIVPSYASGSKLLQIRAYGAKVVVKGSRSDAANLAMQEAKKGTFYASHVWNPFFIEGTKTFAFEVWEQMERKEPDVVVLPAGHGTLLLGAYKGFLELKELGMIENLPRLFGIQAEGCSPIVDRLHGGSESEGSSHLAEGIMIKDPPRLDEMVKSIVETGGDALTVGDHEIKENWKKLAEKGLFVEPTSAASLAGLEKLMKERLVDRDESIVVPLTGSGLKTPQKIARLIS
ncbi:MAG: threonine synthase [Thermoproteota archaeon]|nr:MAG: threonine synthase [Candidatus Korarchaeota archaeon]